MKIYTKQQIIIQDHQKTQQKIFSHSHQNDIIKKLNPLKSLKRHKGTQ